MHTVRVSKTVDASLAEVWAVLDDFGGVSKYNPNVAFSEIVAGPETGRGATRACVFHDGGGVEERIVEYEAASGYTVDFVDLGGLPLKRNRVAVSVDEHDGGGTTVTMAATFAPRFGPVGWVLAKLMMESTFRETFEEVLGGLESYLHTGQESEATGQVSEPESG